MKINTALPGADLIIKGLINLRSGKKTAEALLVLIGSPRLRRLGIEVPELQLKVCPELALYNFLSCKHKTNAYSLYNSYLRRLISFEHAYEQIKFG